MQLEPDSIYNVCRLGNDENVRARQSTCLCVCTGARSRMLRDRAGVDY